MLNCTFFFDISGWLILQGADVGSAAMRASWVLQCLCFTFALASPHFWPRYGGRREVWGGEGRVGGGISHLNGKAAYGMRPKRI